MATVTVEINGRPYAVGCEDGQEAHVEALAREFDRQVREVGSQVGQVGDLRLFLMAALVGADELGDAKIRLSQLQSQLAGKAAEQADIRRRAAMALQEAAQRIEVLTAEVARAPQA